MKNNSHNNNNNNNIPNNNPSKAMDSRKEVDRSNDAKIDQDLPGYPHYPAKEDIMDKRTESHRVNADVENIPSGRNDSGVNERFLKQDQSGEAGKNSDNAGSGQDDSERLAGQGEDMNLLDSKNQEIGKPQNVSNEDLENNRKIPGTPSEDENSSFNKEGC